MNFLKQNSIHTQTAFSAIYEYLKTGSVKNIESQKIPDELNYKAACFVTLKTEKNKLRGCIGTLKPFYENLHKEIIKNAVSAAFRDPRFEKITLEELKKTKITVEVLLPPEQIFDISLLNPEKFGLIISDNTGKRGVLLPGIKTVDTVEKQIEIVKNKAGIYQKGNEGLNFYRFLTQKYY